MAGSVMGQLKAALFGAPVKTNKVVVSSNGSEDARRSAETTSPDVMTIDILPVAPVARGQPRRPRRIILIRHGQSVGNIDQQIYSSTPDWKVPLTDKGCAQAAAAGKSFRAILDKDETPGPVFVYTSPYKRCQETVDHLLLGADLPTSRIVGRREEPRIREQDFGNFQDPAQVRECKAARPRRMRSFEIPEEQDSLFARRPASSRRRRGLSFLARPIEARYTHRGAAPCRIPRPSRPAQVSRDEFGRFFYRFPNGESGADVYDRVSTWLETMYREMEYGTITRDTSLVLCTHGLTARLILMRWYHWSVESFEKTYNPRNAQLMVMDRVLDAHGGLYYALSAETINTIRLPIEAQEQEAKERERQLLITRNMSLREKKAKTTGATPGAGDDGLEVLSC